MASYILDPSLLRRARIDAGLSIEEAANLIGVDPEQIEQWEIRSVPIESFLFGRIIDTFRIGESTCI